MKEIYEIRQLQKIRPDGGLQWGVYKVLDDDHVTAVALCYDEDAAKRICDLLNDDEEAKYAMNYAMTHDLRGDDEEAEDERV